MTVVKEPNASKIKWAGQFIRNCLASFVTGNAGYFVENLS